MLIVSRCLERIGDHAVDIGEQTAYLSPASSASSRTRRIPRGTRSTSKSTRESAYRCIPGDEGRESRPRCVTGASIANAKNGKNHVT